MEGGVSAEEPTTLAGDEPRSSFVTPDRRSLRQGGAEAPGDAPANGSRLSGSSTSQTGSTTRTVNHEAASERSHGPEGAIATVEWLHNCFGDLRYEIERVVVEGDMAAAYVTMSGTHEGGLPPGLPATHQPFSVKHVI